MLSKAVIEIVHERQNTQLDSAFAVFHLINPTAITWKSLLEPIHAMYGTEEVTMEKWVEELKQTVSLTPDDLASKPALKLLPFYQSLVEGEGALSVPLEMENTKVASATMRSLSPITPAMMANWVRQWAF